MSTSHPGADSKRALSLAAAGRLGRFEVLGRLGGGAMGEVFRARDTELGREVAIKVIGQRFHGRPEAIARFSREARAASALNHPNIVVVFDIGEHEGFPYIVMELVEGDSLRAVLGRGPLPLERALVIGTQIARAVSEAHERGIVHRDLKPENVLVPAEGPVKLVDFGLAQFHAVAEPGGSLVATEQLLTEDGSLIGTLGYMAPEFLTGNGGDHRTDQFSLGAVLYEIITGSRPFQGQSSSDLLAATLRDEAPPISASRPGTPAALGELVRRCLSKSPEGRYASTRELVAVLEAISTQSSTPAPLPAPATPLRTSLPAALTPLIGREQEVARVEALLSDPQVRLVTITGPPGCGKTRLALQVAQNLKRASTQRIVFVPLGTVQDPQLVPLAIAREVGAQPGPGQTDLDAVRAECATTEPTLLLLDNFEHLIAAAPMAAELLAACPSLKVLVTSREVLRVYGEHDFDLPPLALPEVGTFATPEELERVPAVALFVERARAASPSFALDAENSLAVVELCRRLEGLPLALELSAARSRLLSPQAMLDRLRSRLQLKAPLRDMPGRQQTLRGTIDWSHELLDPAEQSLFRRLGAFVGGFTLEAAQAVADPFETLELDLVDGIGSLVDKSLVSRLSKEAGEERFGMLETLREYALERLEESGEEGPTRKAHAAYFVVLAEEGGGALARAEDPRWLKRFEAEHDNFRAALGWLIGQNDSAWGLRMALGLFHFWERGEHLSEGQRWFEALLELAEGEVTESTIARALFSAGVLAFARGKTEEGAALQGRSLEIYRRLEDPWGKAVVLNSLSTFDDPETGRKLATEALELWKLLGDDLGYARSLCNLAMALRKMGLYNEARSGYEEAAKLFAIKGDRIGQAWGLNHQADLARERRDFAGAEALYREALGIFEEAADAWGIASSLADLGTLEEERDNQEGAHGFYRDALRRFNALGHRRGVARLLESLAALSSKVGQGERALLLATAAAALRERFGAPLSREEQEELAAALEGVRKSVGREGVRAIEVRARRLTLQAAVDEALND